MAQTLTVKPQYVNTSQVFLNGKFILLNNDLTQEQLLAIWQKSEFRQFIDITYTNVADSFPESFEIDPNLFHAYDSGEVSHNPAKTDYPANTVGKHLNDVKTKVDQIKGFRKKAVLPLDFSASRTLPKDLQLSRASVGSFRDFNGGWKFAKANRPRFHYDEFGECQGLLLEELRTNLIKYRSFADFVEGYFGRPTTSIETDVFGEQKAISFPISEARFGPNTDICGFIFTDSGVPTGTKLSNSFFIKSDKPVEFIFGMDDGITQVFLSDTKWRRIEFSSTTASSRLFMLSFSKNTTVNAQLPLATKIYLCCPQSEAGEFVTSYIPTNGTPQTRQADVLSLSMTSQYINKINGGFVIEMAPLGKLKTNTPQAVIATGNDAILIENKATTVGSWDGTNPRTINGNMNSNSNPVAFYWNENAYTLGFNATLQKSGQLNTAYFWGSNQFVFGSRIGGSNHVNSTIRRLLIFNRALTDAELLFLIGSSSKYQSTSSDMMGTMDLEECAYLRVRELLVLKNRQEFSIDGTGASVTRNIRRDYDFTFEIVDSSGVTITAQPASSCVAGTDNALTFTAPLGKTLTYAITPVFEY